ncbi:glycosyltransferase family 2 protein [Azospirillum sp. TSO35-2]|uniref:glycosyltransferase family 2 protein n=1 Tax=Azospirillum sp. TSO35-2 TaxID=716796 RepID=UPI000D61F077|nr:glycosyltransferase family 2 protein [Azospirillum sp. TSO35-2]PWC35990.1 hypothetical protein TSO352_12450 [Azospirillum sp. TSO35-2]
MSQFLIITTLACIVLQGFHYVGYPAIMLALASLRPRPVDKRPLTPTVSMIISAFNEAETILAKLQNTLELDYPQLEIIVVSDGSDDGTPAMVERFAGQSGGRAIIGLHDPRRRGKGAAMNRGAAVATGEILVFSDANAFYLTDALRRLVAGFADPSVGCVSGRKMVKAADAQGRVSPVGEPDGWYWRYENRIRCWESAVGSTVSVVGEILAIRRALYRPVPETIINDDAYLGLAVQRSGYRVVCEETAVCWEYPSTSVRDEVARRRRMTAGRYQILLRPANWPWQRPQAVFSLFAHKFLRLLLPLLMVGALLGNAALALDWPMPAPMLVLLVLQAGFYGLALLGLLLERSGRKWRLPHVAYYLTASNLGALHGLIGYARGTQGVLWAKARRTPILESADQP